MVTLLLQKQHYISIHQKNSHLRFSQFQIDRSEAHFLIDRTF